MKQMTVIPCVLLMLTITAHQHVLVYDDRSDHATVTDRPCDLYTTQETTAAVCMPEWKDRPHPLK